MKKFDFKKIFLTQFLLAIYLMVIALGSVHVHDEHENAEPVNCKDCLDHKYSHNHLVKWIHSCDDCALCDLLHGFYLSPTVSAVTFLSPNYPVYCMPASDDEICRTAYLPSQRAPPFSL